MSTNYESHCEKDNNDYEDDYKRDYQDEDNKNDCHCDNRKDHCETVKGNSFDVEIRKCDCEVRADIVVGRKKRCIRLWGQVKDCEGIPVEDALVKLLKPCYKNGKIEFEGVAHTQTDCLGFYQFEICLEDEKDKYRVIVSKASKGHERIIDCNYGNCNPCKD